MTVPELLACRVHAGGRLRGSRTMRLWRVRARRVPCRGRGRAAPGAPDDRDAGKREGVAARRGAAGKADHAARARVPEVASSSGVTPRCIAGGMTSGTRMFGGVA